ncbi:MULTISPECIES: hypothetical protein [Curtobacterium]|jgi:hypothetical protein|uniref:hypothetical protein n=2 Tax=cellular organisms TaxID=131567 RepID=UPI000F474C07|nr:MULTISPECIES: hypothetical protein [Curtobacterium]NQW90050.1 hypothetical protein [Curtobacterium sp. VKM Ac-2861]QSB23649.1 hypothetical protein JN350_02500 [Curtobacterium sp. 24E2]MBF4586401.1 hypothetical protein [Curtobacterium sp. VKM Ac-2887]MBT1621141.1 hypothetical protein [Curtobacterium flaccumfaciens pv. oortii]ROQ16482.1 hypothetical protein EDF41_1160 [Curtobacterium sp. PhB171]
MTDQSEAASTPLALTSVVASGLPTELGKPTAAKYYDVPAVFNRRPDAAEMAGLRGADGHAQLVTAGYPDVTLDVQDRRLVIGNTNLGQLERGLATVVATIVDVVSRASLFDKEQVRDAARIEFDDRTARAREVTRAAERIHFVPEPSRVSAG